MAARPPTDVFRPCLPVDPFAGLEPGPWTPSISPHADPPNAVLVLGDPPPQDLRPLLFSQSLAHSLLVIATHASPHIPHTPVPAVRILRLTSPLGQDAGALRLVGLLERAERVVNAVESSRKLVQLSENSKTGEFDVEEVYSARTRQEVMTRYPSPAPSVASSRSSSSSSTASSSFSRRRRARVQGASGSRPATQRAFDAIIHFLPSSLPDKFLLKQAILISTLSASFLAAPPAPLSHTTSLVPQKNPRRLSALFSSHRSYAHSAPSSHDQLPLVSSNSSLKGKSKSQLNLSHHHPFHRRPHLVHILPSHVYPYSSTSTMGASDSSRKPQQKSKPKPNLVQSIEQFLLAFGYPLQSMSRLPSTTTSPSGSRRISSVSAISPSFGAEFGTQGTGEKPVPFLLPSGVFGSVPSGGRLSIGEILLMGGFDGTGTASECVGGMGMEEGRVWIASPDSVVWADDDPASSFGESNSREVAFTSFPSSPHNLQPPPQSQPHPTRQNDIPLHAASTHRHSSSPIIKNPPSAHQLAPPPPAARHASFSGISPTKHTSNPISKKIIKKQKQLPTPPESASSLEDGDGRSEEGSTTLETAETAFSHRDGKSASTTDHHHHHHWYQQDRKTGAHYVKAASSVGHGTSLLAAGAGSRGGGDGRVKKGGFMTRFGLGKLMGLKLTMNSVERS